MTKPEILNKVCTKYNLEVELTNPNELTFYYKDNPPSDLIKHAIKEAMGDKTLTYKFVENIPEVVLKSTVEKVNSFIKKTKLPTRISWTKSGEFVIQVLSEEFPPELNDCIPDVIKVIAEIKSIKKLQISIAQTPEDEEGSIIYEKDMRYHNIVKPYTPKRTNAISTSDSVDLKILLESCESIDQFINSI